MKTLVLDIETGPALAYCWGLFKQNIGINQIHETGEVLCFAAKWTDKKKVMYYSSFHHGKEAMVKAAWDLLNEADAVVHFNGKSFDIPHLQREFLLAGYNPPAPFAQIDLLLAVRKQFRFVSNKLDHVVQELGLGHKVHHTGFDLWKRCLEGDPKAWDTMRSYNRGDIHITQALYDKLLPWIPAHPSVGLFEGLDDACPSCGSSDLQSRGYAYTSVSAYQRLVCLACGKWSRSNKRVEGSSVRGI